MKTFTAYFNYIDGITLPASVVDDCSHSGPCDYDVETSRLLPEVIKELERIDPEQLKRELGEYGAWEDDELNDHDENLTRILWLACGSIADTEEWIEYSS